MDSISKPVKSLYYQHLGTKNLRKNDPEGWDDFITATLVVGITTNNFQLQLARHFLLHLGGGEIEKWWKYLTPPMRVI